MCSVCENSLLGSKFSFSYKQRVHLWSTKKRKLLLEFFHMLRSFYKELCCLSLVLFSLLFLPSSKLISFVWMLFLRKHTIVFLWISSHWQGELQGPEACKCSNLVVSTPFPSLRDSVWQVVLVYEEHQAKRYLSASNSQPLRGEAGFGSSSKLSEHSRCWQETQRSRDDLPLFHRGPQSLYTWLGRKLFGRQSWNSFLGKDGSKG